MVTVENKVGRLIEVRQSGRVTIEELQGSFPLFQQILASKPGCFVMATDWRGMKLLDSETSEFLLSIMRAENDRIQRQVIVIDPSAVMGLQIRRLFKDAGGETRAVFDGHREAASWMEPSLTALEWDSYARFMNPATAA
ncbi:MAG: hypothetical protein V3V08_11210 [Nannocystaceae bacterium]